MLEIANSERKQIKDYRLIQYKILAFEVDNRINGIKPFEKFLSQKLIIHSPAFPVGIHEPSNRSAQFTLIRTPKAKIRTNLPEVNLNHHSIKYSL